jgi:TatA/E family protein of Tat protein translocase
MAIGPTQILIILIVLVLLFGASRLPQLGKNLGSGIRNFKKGLTEGEADDEEAPKKLDAADDEVKRDA